MSSELNNSSGAGFRNKVMALHKMTLKLVRRVDGMELLLDDLQCRLRELLEELSAKGFKKERKTEPGPQNQPRVAGSVVLAPGNKGSAVLFIDHRSPGIGLSPRLARLMEALIKEEGIVIDGLVGWKTSETLQAALQKCTQEPQSRASIKELIYRLRKLLKEHKENAALVQFDRNLGYRFALIRKVEKPENRYKGASTDAPPAE